MGPCFTSHLTSFDALTIFPDNTATWWFRDRGLRLCMANILVLFLCVFAQGFDGILLNGLQALPSWLE